MSKEQEQFEADYLAAFPIAVASQPNLFEKDSDGDYGNVKACAAFGAWLQQAKRHEAEKAELEKQKSSLCGLMEDLLENMVQPPERNCSCHISPPCGDCVDWGGLREVIECCKSSIAKCGVKS